MARIELEVIGGLGGPDGGKESLREEAGMFEELLARLDEDMTETELGKVLQQVTQSTQLDSAQRLKLLRVVGARLKERPAPQANALSSASVRAVDGDA